MRLIDADELKRKLQSRHDNGNDDFDKGYNVGLGTAIDLIDCSPTIDIPIRYKGEWIIDGHHRRCNYCNEYTCAEDREGNSIPDNFCPNCGADMREEGDT